MNKLIGGISFAFLVPFWLAGCSQSLSDVDSQPVAEVAEIPVEGSPESMGVLALLNDVATTFERLESQVPLERAVANSIVDFKSGEDGLTGTPDDRFFSAVSEVMALRFVEPVSMQRLVGYASDEGFVPEGDEVLGHWDEHWFTVNQAAVVLHVVNRATVEELDFEVPLDRRAVDGIIEARPLASILALSEVHYVGESAMGLIFDYAQELYPDWNPPSPCRPVVTETSEGAAAAFDQLLGRASLELSGTTRLRSFEIRGCDDLLADSLRTQEVSKHLWNKVFSEAWSDEYLSDRARRVSEWKAGGMVFEQQLSDELEDIEWVYGQIGVSTVNPMDGVLFGMRYDLLDELLDEPQDRPVDFLEIEMSFSRAVCVEDAKFRVDSEFGTVLVLHHRVGCE